MSIEKNTSPYKLCQRIADVCLSGQLRNRTPPHRRSLP